MVGPYPIFGLRLAEVMGVNQLVVDENRRLRQQSYPGVDDWLVIAMDYAGNPYGIAADGRAWVSDHDFGQIEPVYDDFEQFLRRMCLKLED